jgi:HEAT repeat protein
VDNSGNQDIAALLRRLSATNADERAEAAEAICRAGEAASAAAVDLVRACGDADDRVREWAAAALEELGPPPPDATKNLGELAGSSDPLVAYWAVTLLGRTGASAASAATLLAGLVDAAADIAVRQRAAWALGKIGPGASAARDALTRAAGNSDPRLARLAAEALTLVVG